jgi:membrane protease YdiL (CAAX protease family)
MMAMKKQTKSRSIFKSVLFCIVFTALLVVFSFFKSFIPLKYERFAYGIIATFVSLLTTWLFLRFDRKTFPGIGLNFERSTLRKFFTGILIGIVLMGIIVMFVIYFSGFGITINKNSGLLNYLLWTSPLILLAFMEEVGFRAYPLLLLKDKLGIRMSIIITSILFALYHIMNGWTLAGSFLGPGICGIVFGLAAIYSKGIAMPTGIHYAFNLTTDAFGTTDKSFNIWIVTQKGGIAVADHQTSKMIELIPAIALLIFGIVCMEWFLRRRAGREY